MAGLPTTEIGSVNVDAEIEMIVNEKSSEGTSLYVANLSFRCNTPELSDVFSKFGKLQSVSVQRWPHGESRGFGFVNFEDPEAADTAMRELQDVVVADRAITIQKSRRSKPHDKTPGTYMGPRSASSKYGTGRSDDRGRPRSRERDDRRRDSRDDYGRSDRYDDRGGRGYSRSYDDRGRSRDDRGYPDTRDRYDDRRGGGRSRERYDDRSRGYGGHSSRYDEGGRGYDDRGSRGGNDRNYGRGRDAYAERPPPPDDRRRY
ncbi:hypothetical protein GUITHDRAFT_119306 [Guillardia theta CCMP2712]|uniref:RRM domain-containing protein n=1 Tax=Guillardia theta (strain CCMP2712) TaxID=905079 RepID=L1IF68_GUITC|nr:hypothetical protein GUITHDRAFT_119306 [Guillardia theta CCMP2712]EKX34559.1 hypothetical protein GUITHDRAFT_119306 [Guillardia theta CCMP2712]|eukprot:XP_005821539.1 hypothetical protein GUITHDRAFT_119306 [Guillardia theta CCMP2712]